MFIFMEMKRKSRRSILPVSVLFLKNIKRDDFSQLENGTADPM